MLVITRDSKEEISSASPGDRRLWPRWAHPLGAPGGGHGSGLGDHRDLSLGFPANFAGNGFVDLGSNLFNDV